MSFGDLNITVNKDSELEVETSGPNVFFQLTSREVIRNIQQCLGVHFILVLCTMMQT
jgi:hypothetical protein